MKLRKIVILVSALIVIIASCKPDDDTVTITYRDRAEVYAEDLEEIETFLETHYYNYEGLGGFDFANPYSEANDNFEIIFGKITDNPTKIALIDRPELKFKTVEDPNEEGLFYKLYYLEVRKGQGSELHGIDKAYVNYEGSLTDGSSFDNSVNPVGFELTSVLNGGVVTGFREALIEFNTATSFDSDAEGTVSYHNHGIGAAFLPSALGYFSLYQDGITSYSPLIFKFSLFDRVLLDHDNDGIPSFLEDLDNDLDVFNDDTSDDDAPNFFDGDDDGDGYNTSDEIEVKSFTSFINDDDVIIVFTTEQLAQDYLDNDAEPGEVLIEIDSNNSGTLFTLNTFIAPDSNGNGTPDYLDDTYPE